VLTVGVAVVAVLAVPAAPSHARGERPVDGLVTAAPAALSGDEAVGGYFVSLDDDVRSASATIRVPTFNCAAGDGELDLGLYTYANSIDIDFPQASAVVFVTCSGGTATYSFEAQALGGTSGGFNSSPVNPGDLIVLSVGRDAAGTTSTVHDLRSHEYISGNNTFATPDTHMFVGAARYSGPVPSFSPVWIRNVYINGQALGDVAHNGAATKGNLVSPTSSDLLVTSGTAVFGSNRFKLTWSNDS
jgi:hypothetical protein